MPVRSTDERSNNDKNKSERAAYGFITFVNEGIVYIVYVCIQSEVVCKKFPGFLLPSVIITPGEAAIVVTRMVVARGRHVEHNRYAAGKKPAKPFATQTARRRHCAPRYTARAVTLVRVRATIVPSRSPYSPGSDDAFTRDRGCPTNRRRAFPPRPCPFGDDDRCTLYAVRHGNGRSIFGPWLLPRRLPR